MVKSVCRAACLTAVLAIPVLLYGQQPASPAGADAPTFKLEVNYVEVDAVVTDAQGHFVRDLTRNDFTVFEDGKPQPISTFSHVDIPVETATQPLFATSPIEPDVASNAQPFSGRIYVLVLDDLHTSPQHSILVQRVARQFIERDLGANDVMAILEIGGDSRSSQTFTSNKRLLLAAVDRFMGQSATSRTTSQINDAFNLSGLREPTDPTTPTGEDVRSYNARVTVETLRNLVKWMEQIHGRRKALLFVSEGLDYDLNNVFGDEFASSVIDDDRQLVSAANRSDVNVYAIDPQGLSNGGDSDIEIGSLPTSQDPTLGHGTAMQEAQTKLDSLRILSDETGGFPIINQNDFSKGFDRLVADNSSYYVLGYYPTNEKRDGKFRKIEVRLDRPGLTVRARKGYLAPKGKAEATEIAGPKSVSAPVREALASPLPVPGLTLHVFAAPFKGTPSKASVLLGVEASGSALKFGQKDGRYADEIEVAYQAIDTKGAVAGGDRDLINLALKPETYQRISQSGIRLLNRMNLAPGRYQIRVAARDSVGQTVGSVRYDLEVPDFYKAPLSMSGLAMTSASAAEIATAKPDAFLKPPVLPAPPAAERTFPADDTVAVFAEVYDNDTAAPHKVDLTTTLTNNTGSVVFKSAETRSTSEFGGKRGGFGYAVKVPLKGVAPGRYVLDVGAKSELGKMPAVNRQVEITVE